MHLRMCTALVWPCGPVYVSSVSPQSHLLSPGPQHPNDWPCMVLTLHVCPAVLQMLLADGHSSVSALTHAVVWRLIHGLGCASVSWDSGGALGFSVWGLEVLSLQALKHEWHMWSKLRCQFTWGVGQHLSTPAYVPTQHNTTATST